MENTVCGCSKTKVGVSIVVPCYNVERHIRACLESLIEQDFRAYEIICVNDGSTDGTAQVLREFTEEYPDLVHVVDKPNEGSWMARLDGIRVASGRYIAFLDGDDTAEPMFLSELYKAAMDSGADIVVCGFRRIGENGKEMSREFCSPRESIHLETDPGRILEVNPAPWNKLFKREVLSCLPSIGCRPVMFDDLVLLLLSYANGAKNISFTSSCLVNYFVRSGSQINSVKPEQLDGARSAMANVRSVYELRALGPAMMESLASMAFLHIGVSMTFRIVSFSSTVVEEEIVKTREFLDGVFPEWNTARCLCFRYAICHGFPMIRIWGAAIAFKSGLLPTLLLLYGRLIDATGIDMKW